MKRIAMKSKEIEVTLTVIATIMSVTAFDLNCIKTAFVLMITTLSILIRLAISER